VAGTAVACKDLDGLLPARDWLHARALTPGSKTDDEKLTVAKLSVRLKTI